MAIYSIKSYIAKGYRNILDGRLKAVVDCSTTASLGRRITVKVGTQTPSTNVYESDRNGQLSEVQYGNGGKVGYTYDDFDRLTGVKYDGETNDRYEYKYGANGMAAEVEDHNLGRIARTDYDQADRPCQTELRDSATGEALYKTGLKYNKLNQLEVFSEKAGSESHKSEYAYDRDNRVTGITYDGGSQKVNYTYDELGRVATRLAECGADAGKLTSAYEYVDGGFGTNSTTPLVKKITQNGISFEYEYDSRGNIVSEKRGNLTTTYAYDALGQLIRVNDPHENATWVYSYDRGGNILSKVKYAYTTGTVGTALETIPYTYGDANWKDKLTAYNGTAITYDAIGNPLNDGAWTYTWAASRQLKKMVREDRTLDFKYNHNGMRIQKVLQHDWYPETTNYTYHGKLLTHMTVDYHDWDEVAQQDKLHFFYDAQSRPVKISYNGVIYTYVHNLQGDIVGILDSTGALVVEYKYDAWGKLLATTGSLADTLGKRNPFRYRGYVYDEETGLYYLRNRYYNVEKCRFINHDRMIIKKEEWYRNGYVYGANSPINRIDPSGNSPKSFVDALIEGAKKIFSWIKKTVERIRIRKSLSSSKTFSYVIDSYDRTYGLFGSFREISTTTLIVIPAENIKDYVFEKWMRENYINTVPVEEGFSYAVDILLEFLPDAFPGVGIAFGVPASITNLMQASDDTKLAQCISKAIENNTGIVIINDSYVSSYESFEKNTYYEFFDYLDSLS